MAATFTLHATYKKPDGTPRIQSREVHIYLAGTRFVKDTAGNTIISGRVEADVVDGELTVPNLPDPRDPAYNPSGFGFTLTANFRDGSLAAISFGAEALDAHLTNGVLELEDVTPVDPSTFSPTATYVETTDLAPVATTGAYADLSGQPVIPTTAADVGADPAGAASTAETNAKTYADQRDAVEVTRADGAYAGKITTPQGGQNVRNLRRPTLVIDKTFPDARHDHQVVWVDEAAKVAYSIGQDRRLRKATWTATGDEALAFGSRISSSPDGSSWAADGVFYRVPTTNTLLMEQRDLGTTNGTVLLRSTNDGGAWTTAWTAPANKRLLGPMSLVRDDTTGYLYLLEYVTGTVATTADIWRSTDDGATWAVWHSHPRSDTSNAAGVIRHWHGARYDSISQRVYFTAGDTGADAGIYRTNAAGTDVEPVILNSQIASAQPSARAIDPMFFPDYLVWGIDGDDPAVVRMARTQIGAANPTVERVAELNSTAWWAQKAANDGTVWVLSTATEPIAGAIDNASHLYAISDNGATVDEVGAVAMDGNVLGYASLSGLCGGNGGGDTFWLRAHNFQMPPNVTYSAFQMRAKVVWGAAPLIKPELRQPEYVRTSRNWRADLTAGQTLTFSHDRAPFRTRKMNVLGVGVKVLSGTGTVALQVYNKTTNTVLMSYSGGQNWRADSVTDTTQLNNALLCAGYDEIELRMVETGGTAACTASVFIEYGWTFP